MKIVRACKKILNGEILILPSDTLYGLAANAYDAKAVFKVFEKKEREITKAFPIHYYSIEQMQQDIEITPLFKELAKNFWPGNLTIIANKKSDSKLKFVGNTVAVRIPNHKILLNIIKRINCPITMPSANKANIAPCTKFKLIKRELRINGIKDDKHLSKQASTIIDISKPKIEILRNEDPQILEKLKKYL